MDDPKITVRVGKAEFEKIMLEAFREAGQHTIERMIEIADPDHKHIIRGYGAMVLKELDD